MDRRQTQVSEDRRDRRLVVFFFEEQYSETASMYREKI